MNRNVASGFNTPFIPTTMASNMDISDSELLQCGQKSPNLSDSPMRSTGDSPILDLNKPDGDVDIEQTITEIENKLKNRIRIATMKESLLYYKGKNDQYPGFMNLDVKFNPNYGSKEANDVFVSGLADMTFDFRTQFFSKMIELCDAELNKQMKAIHDIKADALNALYIKDPKSGNARTELLTKFDQLLNKYRKERATYAAKLRNPKGNTDQKRSKTSKNSTFKKMKKN